VSPVGGEKTANVPLIATLPLVGPAGAMATAPAAYGHEAFDRSLAGGMLGTPTGAVGGGLLGALLGAGAGALSGEDHPYTEAGALLGGGVGALAGNMMGSHMALKPIYAQQGGYGMGAPPAPAGHA
jgi:hypothetical protein